VQWINPFAQSDGFVTLATFMNVKPHYMEIKIVKLLDNWRSKLLCKEILW